jgi:antitoxin component YwqK of YwqJK toxin-antitoxin module
MKIRGYILFAILGLITYGCNDSQKNDEVVSQRYIHKYGYAMSQNEWESRDYPGQVITHLRNGIVVTATYENGILNGPMTQTFPHSQTVEHYTLYNQGSKVKEILYDALGLPISEKIQLSPSRYSVTRWYDSGTPMMIEDFVGNELLEGQYFTATNDIESRIEKGSGMRIVRRRDGSLLAKEDYEGGFTVKKETFHPNGVPESIATYSNGKLNGERKTFAASGEPLSVEEMIDDQLHGKATYYEKGNKCIESSYLYGQKNGIERRYVDGEILSEEISFENNQKHGPATYFIGDRPHHEYYYAGEKISKRKYIELSRLDEMITHISPDVKSAIR